MSVATVRSVLLWCTIINYAILAFWSLLATVLPHGWLYRVITRWYRISAEQLDIVSYAGILGYKILIFVFNLVPYVALSIVG